MDDVQSQQMQYRNYYKEKYFGRNFVNCIKE